VGYLLKFSTQRYKADYRTAAVNVGVILRDLFTDNFCVSHSDEEIFIFSQINAFVSSVLETRSYANDGIYDKGVCSQTIMFHQEI
jgi:hypothetical protein